MEKNAAKKIAQQFFDAYDRHDVEAMTALCTSDARGRYVPYGRESVAPIRGGIDAIWGAFPQTVPDFRAEVIEMMLAEGNSVVAQTGMSGPIPPDPLGISKQAQAGGNSYSFYLCFLSHVKI